MVISFVKMDYYSTFGFLVILVNLKLLYSQEGESALDASLSSHAFYLLCFDL